MDITSTLQDYHLLGLVIGICTFLVIGLFHPVVVKCEYHYGTSCWWWFLLLGCACTILSLREMPLHHKVLLKLGLRMHHPVADHKRHPRLDNTRSGGIFFVLDDKGDIRAAGACKERLVST